MAHLRVNAQRPPPALVYSNAVVGREVILGQAPDVPLADLRQKHGTNTSKRKQQNPGSKLIRRHNILTRRTCIRIMRNNTPTLTCGIHADQEQLHSHAYTVLWLRKSSHESYQATEVLLSKPRFSAQLEYGFYEEVR